jgi:hypothetical protein
VMRFWTRRSSPASATSSRTRCCSASACIRPRDWATCHRAAHRPDHRPVPTASTSSGNAVSS